MISIILQDNEKMREPLDLREYMFKIIGFARQEEDLGLNPMYDAW